MLKGNTSQKGVILLIVLGTVVIVIIFAGVILGLMTSQSRLTLHQVSRTKAHYAAKGIMNYSLDMLRKGEAAGGWAADPANNRYVCHSKSAGGNCAGLGQSPPYYATIPTDSDIPYNILVTIYPLNRTNPSSSLDGQVTQLDIKTDYTYIAE